ncbi:MAG: restriction endonuclease [Pseudomonadales bacterium]|nr:restriction endonuclease [Pseudomonadales bacterium]
MVENPFGDVIAYLVLILCFAVGVMFARGKLSHTRRIKTARRVLKKLQAIETPSAQFAYLRKIDPFVFEELILEAFHGGGLKIERNRRYTGDGGIDGKVKIHGRYVLIQAKRYSGYIDNKDIDVFSRLCEKMVFWGCLSIRARQGKGAIEKNLGK